jgi:hypothetical protein
MSLRYTKCGGSESALERSTRLDESWRSLVSSGEAKSGGNEPLKLTAREPATTASWFTRNDPESRPSADSTGGDFACSAEPLVWELISRATQTGVTSALRHESLSVMIAVTRRDF